MENLFAFYDPTTGRIVQRTTVNPEVDERKLGPDEDKYRLPTKPAEKVAEEFAARMGLLAVKSNFTLPIDKTYIDVETKEHRSMGEPPSQHHSWDWTNKQWVFNKGAVDAIWQNISAERDRRSLQGGVKVGDTWFHSDSLSRSKYANLAITETNEPEWKAMGGVWVGMTWQLAREVLLALAANDKALFEAAQAHRTALEASTYPERYDWYGNWPITFEEAQALTATIPAQR